MSGVPRKELAAVLKPLLPKGWQIVYSERSVDQHGTVLRLQQRRIRRHQQGGTGVHEIDFDATLTVAGEDLAKAEDRLDDELTALVSVLDEKTNLRWTEWTKSLYDGFLGYQSTLSCLAFKEL